jgi:soluble lytic murein transglycosylase-like protein
VAGVAGSAGCEVGPAGSVYGVLLPPGCYGLEYSPRMRAWPHAILILAVVAAPGLSRAAVYSFTEANGVTHFSNVPSDSRYQLLIAGPTEAATGSPKEHSIDWLARSAQYDGVIRGAAQAATIQAALVRAVIVVESGFNPRAVSKKGAIGLMQLQPATAKRYGVKNIYDPEQNVRAGAHYLSDLLARFDSNLELALAAYNAGEEAVERYGRRVPPFRETLAYVPSVMKVYQRLMNQAHAS